MDTKLRIGDQVVTARNITRLMLGIAEEGDDDAFETVYAQGTPGSVVEIASAGYPGIRVQIGDADWWLDSVDFEKARDAAAPEAPEGNRWEWVILQLMGQRTVAGRAQSSNRWGQNMIMLEVPATGDNAPFTRFYAHGAIYAITPVSEAVARVVAAAVKEPPVESRFMKDGGVS